MLLLLMGVDRQQKKSLMTKKSETCLKVNITDLNINNTYFNDRQGPEIASGMPKQTTSAYTLKIMWSP